MLRGLKSRNSKIAKSQKGQRGYMMITLMLALALITIGWLTVLPAMRQQILRDREEEMIHRGTAYMRAIQRFHRALGRYPSRIEDLENTNNRRFLRKRYKDPMSRDPVTGKEKDFKLLYQTDILGQTLGLGGQGGVPPQGGLGGAGDQTAASADSGNSASGSSGNASDAEGNSNSSGSSSSNSNTGSNSGAGFNGPTFGGGAIMGVASTSNAKTIREFYNKTRYKDWLFIYLEQADRGGLLKGPVNPGLPTTNLTGGASGQQPAAGGTGGQTQILPQPQQNSGGTPPQQ